MSGDHKKIKQRRRAASIERTAKKRPDLLKSADLNEEDNKLLLKYKQKEGME